jgi:hypothetical protein
MAKAEQLHYNDAGTHVFVVDQDGNEWECPVAHLPVARLQGFTPTAPRDRSLDGLIDQTGFDPADHSVDEVNSYLAEHADASPGEVVRVLTLEQAGQNRKTIKDPRIATDDADAGADTNTPA